MMRIAFSDRAGAMAFDRTAACIANPGDGNAVNRKVAGGHADDFATMGRGIPETDYIGHRSTFLHGRHGFG
jgi:hypothetical protein